MLIKVDLRSKKSLFRRTYQRMYKNRQTKLENFWVDLQTRYLREIISAYFSLDVYERDWRHTQRRQVVVLLTYRRIFVYTFCLINICLPLSDDANEIKTLNIERA